MFKINFYNNKMFNKTIGDISFIMFRYGRNKVNYRKIKNLTNIMLDMIEENIDKMFDVEKEELKRSELIECKNSTKCDKNIISDIPSFNECHITKNKEVMFAIDMTPKYSKEQIAEMTIESEWYDQQRQQLGSSFNDFIRSGLNNKNFITNFNVISQLIRVGISQKEWYDFSTDDRDLLRYKFSNQVCKTKRSMLDVMCSCNLSYDNWLLCIFFIFANCFLMFPELFKEWSRSANEHDKVKEIKVEREKVKKINDDEDECLEEEEEEEGEDDEEGPIGLFD